jgi:hypothetical protein
MELGVFYQFFQVQGYGHRAWKSLRTKVSARRAFLLWIFPSGRIISVVRQQDVKIADGDVWVFVRPPVRDNDPAASRE